MSGHEFGIVSGRSCLCKVCESGWDDMSMASIGLGIPGRLSPIPQPLLKPASLLIDVLVPLPPASH